MSEPGLIDDPDEEIDEAPVRSFERVPFVPLGNSTPFPIPRRRWGDEEDETPRLVSEPPTVANSVEPTCDVPSGLDLARRRAEAAGWSIEGILYGRAEIVKRRKIAAQPGDDDPNRMVETKTKEAKTEQYLLTVNSVSLRIGRQRHDGLSEVAYGVWANGKFDGAGHAIVGQAGSAKVGLGSTELTRIIGSERT